MSSIERMAAALKPFADFADDIDSERGPLPDSTPIYGFTAGDFREVRAALDRPVFSPEEVARIWQYQFGPWASPLDRQHPLTCSNRSSHPEIAGDKGILVPTRTGLICPFCNYRQTWVPGAMLAAGETGGQHGE